LDVQQTSVGTEADFFEGLDPFAPALYPVAWAGEQRSANWFDVAREYNEKWHHTQQIFEAVGRPSTIASRRLMHPCLDAFMRALRFAYREVRADEGAAITVTVQGEAGGDWYLVRDEGRWQQVPGTRGLPTPRVSFGQDSAWKLFTKLFTKRMDRQKPGGAGRPAKSAAARRGRASPPPPGRRMRTAAAGGRRPSCTLCSSPARASGWVRSPP
jgi:hypothetical protein